MDNRFGERIALWTPAELHAAKGCTLEATVLDISLSGLGLVLTSPTDCRLKPLQPVTVVFEPLGPDAGTLVLNAHLARVAADRVGLTFVELQPELMQRMKSFVAAPPRVEGAPLHSPMAIRPPWAPERQAPPGHSTSRPLGEMVWPTGSAPSATLAQRQSEVHSMQQDFSGVWNGLAITQH